jgi:hypothetical protein
MKYALPIYEFDFHEPNGMRDASRLLGWPVLFDYLGGIAQGERDCTTCSQLLRLAKGHPQEPRTLAVVITPDGAGAACACQECTTRYGSTKAAADMLGEYFAGLMGDPAARIVPADEAEAELADDDATGFDFHKMMRVGE